MSTFNYRAIILVCIAVILTGNRFFFKNIETSNLQLAFNISLLLVIAFSYFKIYQDQPKKIIPLACALILIGILGAINYFQA